MEFKQDFVAEPEIIYEDENFLAVNKPAGLLVHGVSTSGKKQAARSAEPNLVDWLSRKYPGIRSVGDDRKMRPGMVHRLDRDASGVMLIAKTQSYFEYLKSLFQKREIKKTYLAVAFGKIKEKRGIIDRPLGIKNGTTKRSVHYDKMAKPAVTEYKILRRGDGWSLLEVYPKTGRTHQIRVHLASIGHPVLGDKLYGKAQGARREARRRNDLRYAPSDMPRLMLHALSLEFTDKSGRRIKIEADAPEEFKKFIEIQQ